MTFSRIFGLSPKGWVFISFGLMACLLILWNQAGRAGNSYLGIVGETYPIVEKDALLQIEEQAGRIDWSRVFNKEEMMRQAKNFKPKKIGTDGKWVSALPTLPAAEKPKRFSVDLTHTLDFNITDRSGAVLYPVDYTFRPLEYVRYPRTLVVIDGADPRQVAWFKASPLAHDLATTLLITGGSYQALSQELKRPVYYADERMTRQFRLEALPSVIRQKGTLMEVEEIATKR